MALIALPAIPDGTPLPILSLTLAALPFFAATWGHWAHLPGAPPRLFTWLSLVLPQVCAGLHLLALVAIGVAATSHRSGSTGPDTYLYLGVVGAACALPLLLTARAPWTTRARNLLFLYAGWFGGIFVLASLVRVLD